jgi:hypothetical protein
VFVFAALRPRGVGKKFHYSPEQQQMFLIVAHHNSLENNCQDSGGLKPANSASSN